MSVFHSCITGNIQNAGSDQWRVTHESDGHVETDYAAPGEYGNIATLINNGIITEIEKVYICEFLICAITLMFGPNFLLFQFTL